MFYCGSLGHANLCIGEVMVPHVALRAIIDIRRDML